MFSTNFEVSMFLAEEPGSSLDSQGKHSKANLVSESVKLHLNIVPKSGEHAGQSLVNLEMKHRRT